MAEVNFMRLMLKRITLTGSTLRSRSNEEKARIATNVHNCVWPWIEAGKVKPVNDSTFRYHEEIEVEVPATLRPEFNTVLAGTDRRGRFVFVDERRIRLVGFSK